MSPGPPVPLEPQRGGPAPARGNALRTKQRPNCRALKGRSNSYLSELDSGGDRRDIASFRQLGPPFQGSDADLTNVPRAEAGLPPRGVKQAGASGGSSPRQCLWDRLLLCEVNFTAPSDNEAGTLPIVPIRDIPEVAAHLGPVHEHPIKYEPIIATDDERGRLRPSVG